MQPPVQPLVQPLVPQPVPPQQQPPQQPQAYAPTFVNGNLPGPVGDTATILDGTPPDMQRVHASDLTTFLLDPTTDLRALNSEHRCFTAIITTPHTRRLRLVFGFGFGTSGIGQVSPIANKLLALYGEGGAAGPPQVLVLDRNIRSIARLLNPRNQDVDAAFQAGHQLGTQVALARNVRNEEDIPRIAPIPAYLCYDGFGTDIEAEVMYERLRMHPHPEAWWTNALTLCRASLVGGWRQTDIQPCFSETAFTNLVPHEGRTWANRQFQTLFPTLQQAPPPVVPNIPAPPAGGGGQAAGGPQLLQLDLATLQQLLAGHAQQAGAQPAEEKKDDPDGLQKVSDREKAKMQIMCGLDDTEQDDAFPRWYRDLFDRNQDDKDKMAIVCDAIEQAWFYDDAEVPLYPGLVKMILKRDWTAGDIGKRAAFVNAAKGLSPFAMMDLTEEDVAQMTEDYTDLTQATTSTTADYKASRAKLKAVIPATAEDFMTMLRRYGNLLFALFTGQSPMYQALYDIIKDLKAMAPQARAALSQDTKAAILWIILLQSRRFAHGHMTGDTPDLWEFTNMRNMIKAKSCMFINHQELPAELLHPKKRKHGSLNLTTDEEPKTRDKAPPKQGGFHPLIKKLLATPLKTANQPSVAQVIAYCNLTRNQLLPSSISDQVCKNFLIQGTCKFGKGCKFEHRTPTDTEAKHVVTAVKRFTDDPLGLRGKTV